MAGGANGSGRPVSVGIVGAGFGGVGMGVRLRRQGFNDFTIFERGETVGGVWRANTYPGAACDVPSHLYSYSFARGHQWTSRYAPQPDILRYLRGVADDFGITPHVRFSTDVRSARFDEERSKWVVEVAPVDGRAGGDGVETHEFDVLVSACGQLSRPAVPKLTGIEDFEGHVFHSAEWDHGYDLRGKRVAVVGTGASAIQFVPEIAPLAERTTIYQRSAPWIVPRSNRSYPAWERRLFKRFPARVVASRGILHAFFEMATYGFTGHDWIMNAMEGVANLYRRRELDDPELRRKATPDYRLGCKRVLFSSDWYPALKRDDVELVDGAVERVTATGLVGADGVEREVDVIIWGTGFEAGSFTAPMEIHGTEGRELNKVWSGRPEAYLGATISGFPNLFVLYGPNTNHGAGSIVFVLECQVDYALDAIRRLARDGFKQIELRPEVQRAWREEIDERSKRTVWTLGGCESWYLNEEGANTNNWPGQWREYRRRTRRLNPADYRVVA